MATSRRQLSEQIRNDAADLAAHRATVRHVSNAEEFEYRDTAKQTVPATHLANFTKGLPHDLDSGLLLNPVDYKLFINGINSGDPVDFAKTPLGPALGQHGAKPGNGDVCATVIPDSPTPEAITPARLDRAQFWQSDIAKSAYPRLDCNGNVEERGKNETGARVRAWESAGAGNVFDLQAPDAQSVTMPPAPRLDSDELVAEMAEDYAMALQRDVPFAAFPLPTATEPDAQKNTATERTAALSNAMNGTNATQFANIHNMLSSLHWFSLYAEDGGYDAAEQARRHDLIQESDVFRGNTPGERVGPYLSQFILLGNDALGKCSPGNRKPTDGFILYGALGIQQKLRIAKPRCDFMTTWNQFIDVQNGADLRGLETYEDATGPDQGHRFIATPRDLATYVHYDALYEAYLNACLWLLSAGAPFDRGLPFLEADAFDKQQGFAHFGGPHILTLVCEVATRALKAVRYQKFNVHRRLRPEAVGGRIDRYMRYKKDGNTTELQGRFSPLRRLVEGKGPANKTEDGLECLVWKDGMTLMDAVKSHNERNNASNCWKETDAGTDSYLLPMAFPEGSPMHPAYGAGHGTVAGACVTILKAYFDHGWTPAAWLDNGQPIAFEPNADGTELNRLNLNQALTVEGELNKLAANIAIGRNWAGVHYYSDYIESLRLGERIALGLLEEQKLTYPENFTMTVPLFDGGAVHI